MPQSTHRNPRLKHVGGAFGNPMHPVGPRSDNKPDVPSPKDEDGWLDRVIAVLKLSNVQKVQCEYCDHLHKQDISKTNGLFLSYHTAQEIRRRNAENAKLRLPMVLCGIHEDLALRNKEFRERLAQILKDKARDY